MKEERADGDQLEAEKTGRSSRRSTTSRTA